MGPLQHRRMREHARRQANLWIGGAGGRTGLAAPLLGGRRGVQVRYPVLVNPDVALPGPAGDFLAPWAWYRGDDLTGSDGDLIASWPDRAGGAGTADREQNDVRLVAEGANGQPGARWSAMHPPGRFRATGFSPTGENGYSLGVVVSGLVGSNGFFEASWADDPTEFTDPFFYFDDAGWSTLTTDTESFSPSNAGSLSGSPGHLLTAVVASDRLVIWLDGAKVGEWFGNPQPANFGEIMFRLSDFFDETEPTVYDVIWWDQSLDDSDVADVWAYAQDRYGL